MFNIQRVTGPEFRNLANMKETDYLKYVLFGTIGFCVFILILFIALMFSKYNQQDKFLDIFYGFTSNDCKHLTKVLDLVI
jgi:hypothetical protein